MNDLTTEFVGKLCDDDKLRNHMFEGLQRLKVALSEQIFRLEDQLRSYEDSDLPCDCKFDILGVEETKSSVIQSTRDWIDTLRWHLHSSPIILLALAFPTDRQASAERHIDTALEEIVDLQQEITRRQEYALSVREYRGKLAATQQKQTGSGSGTRTDPSGSDAQKSPDKDKRGVSRRPSTGSPYLKLMNDLTSELGLELEEMKKNQLLYLIEEHWPTEILGDRSGRLADAMATLMRPPEAQKGRARRLTQTVVARGAAS